MVVTAKEHFLDCCQNVFLAKSTLNMIGYVLKAAIVCTFLNAALVGEKGYLPKKDFSGSRLHWALITYFILLFVVLGFQNALTRGEKSLTTSKQRLETYKAFSAALTMIPAWGFKDLVAAGLTGQPWWAALLVLALATLLAVLLAPSPPEAGDMLSLLGQLRKTMASCMALGVAFAIHTIPRSLWNAAGYSFFTVPVTATYAVVMTCIIVGLQLGLKKPHDAAENRFYKTFLNFIMLSGNFIAAWALDGFLDTLRRTVLHWVHDDCYTAFAINALWATMVLLMCSGIILFTSYHFDHDETETEYEVGLRGLMAIACACTVAWAWLDVFVGIYKCTDWRGWHIVGAWIMFLITLLGGVALMTFGSQAIEKLKKQADDEDGDAGD